MLLAAQKMEAAHRAERRGGGECVEMETTSAGGAAGLVGGRGGGKAGPSVGCNANGVLNVSRNVATLDDVMASVGGGQRPAASTRGGGGTATPPTGLGGGGRGESGSADEDESDEEELIDPAALRREMLRGGR